MSKVGELIKEALMEAILEQSTPSEIDRMIDDYKTARMGSRAYSWGHRVVGGKSSSKYRSAHYAMEETYINMGNF